MALIGRSWGIQSFTGHPVMMVIIIEVEVGQAITSFIEKGVVTDMYLVACIFGVPK